MPGTGNLNIPAGSQGTEMNGGSSRVDTLSSSCDEATFPEKKICFWAIAFAILEKAASGFGKLAFIWATVVLLGGFATSLKTVDFWFVTIILLTEGFRIFSRSHEVEWQHETMLTSMVTFGAETRQLSSKLLSRLQLLFATICGVLSLCRLVTQYHAASDTKNLKSALIIFYVLPLAESLLLLVKKACWKLNLNKLLKEVSTKYGFHNSSNDEIPTIRSFFYIVYSQCVNGSIFDGLKMGFVTYSVELLQSRGRDGQVTGARVVSKLVKCEPFEEDTLRAIMNDVVERLIEMLNWNNEQDIIIRTAAAEIISKLVTKIPNRIRVTAIAGSMESIASLLYYTNNNNLELVSLGLTILERLAEEHSNCEKIGSSGGLLSKIIALTYLTTNQTANQDDTNYMALQLLKKLASTTGSTGKALRKQIQERVYAISNLKYVLEIGRPDLQILAIDTLTSLALEQDDRKHISCTGGVLPSLVSIFFMERTDDIQRKRLVNTAGEALGFLSLEDEDNCEIMLSIKQGGHSNFIAPLISVLGDTDQDIHAAKILRNLCPIYKNRGAEPTELSEITKTAVQVVIEVFRRLEPFIGQKDFNEDFIRLEAFIGLAAKFHELAITGAEFHGVLKEFNATKQWLISQLEQVFKIHLFPSRKVPNIRRFSIELLISVMNIEHTPIIEKEKKLELVAALEGVMETTNELENYSAFSGSVGLCKQGEPIRSLAKSAIKQLRKSKISRAHSRLFDQDVVAE